MKKILNNIQPNNFFSSPTDSVLTQILEKNNLDIDYGYILLGYPNWHEDGIDLFQYFDHEFLNSLKEKNTILIVDYTYEGFSPAECPIIKILENNCSMYNVDPKKVFYFSGNLKDISDKINVIPIFTLDFKTGYGPYRMNWDKNTLDYKKTKCVEKLEDKIFLSLSRRNRFHRVIAHAILTKNNISQYGLISQDTIKNFRVYKELLDSINYSEKDWKRFSKILPLIADENNFSNNQPFNPLLDLHDKTLFSIVNETLANSHNGTSLFFSEKILKPIINFQPMVIYGQPGINHALKELGFMLYDDYFDLSFDMEENDILRYKKLLSSIEPVVNMLASYTKEEKINWRFKHARILQHNYNVFLNELHSSTASKKFAEIISKIN